MTKQLFELGQVVATQGIANKIHDDGAFGAFVLKSFARYINGDWGEMAELDRVMNDEAMRNGDDRILAAYTNADHPDWKIWIITEWDRSATTLLFPDEY